MNAPLPRVRYTATLLSSEIIVFIGRRELYLNNLRDVNINQVNKLNIFVKNIILLLIHIKF
jgi:hypothetical protein